MQIKEFLEKVKKELDEGKEFEFWKLLEEAEKVCSDINTQILGQKEDAVKVDGNVFLSEGAVIKAGSRIEGNVFIGKNSVIGPNAYLRKNVVIGENCHIANSEIKNSIILSNSNLPHYSYVGDSVIGENVNLGAGTKIANLRFDDANINVRIAGEKIDSGRRKLGALINSNTKIGINCSVNCGIIIAKNCQIFPARIVEKNLKEKEVLR